MGDVNYPTLADTVGDTPLIRLQRLYRGDNTVLVKLEGNNPAGSVKDRPALNMIMRAEQRGEIEPGDRLIEATSGNTGIALAMAAAIKGYPMTLVMPENMSTERRATMKAFGAEIILVSAEAGMEGARDLALEMQAEGKGRVLDQFANQDNSQAHYAGTGPEIWRDTRAALRTLSVRWELPARLWEPVLSSNNKTRRLRSLASHRRRVRRFPVFGVGPRVIYPRFSILKKWTGICESASRKLNGRCVSWLTRKVFFVGFHRAVA